MPFKNYVFSGEDLGKFETLHAMEGDNPYVLEIIAYSPETGLTGATLVREPGTPVDDAVSRFEAGLSREEDGPVRVMGASLNEPLLKAALAPKTVGYPSDRDAPYADVFRDMIQEVLGDRAFNLLRTLPASNPASFDTYRGPNETVAYNVAILSGGDRSARQQALASYPALHALIARDADALNVIDNRQSLNALLKDRYDMTGEDLHVFRKINTSLSALIGSGEDVPAIERKFLGATDNVAKVARMLNADQVPEDPQKTLLMLRKISGLEEFCQDVKLGDTIVQRSVRSISAEGWKDALEGAERGRFGFDRGLTDYLGAVATPLAGAMVLEEVRDRHPDLLEGLGESASRLFSDEEISREDSERLASFVKKAEHVSVSNVRRAAEETVREMIGDSAGLKELRERATRWHHVNQLLDSEMVSTDMDIDWTALAGELDLGDGLVARELNSSAALRVQGRDENHCVGSYTNVILNPPYGGAKAIFSIEKDGDTVSTVEISVTCDHVSPGPAFAASPTQHQAENNTRPGDAAEEGVRRLTRALNDLPKDRGLESYVSAIHGNAHSLRQSAGRLIGAWKGNVFSASFPEVSLETCREVFPKSMRDISLADVRDRFTKNRDGKDPVTRAVDVAFDGAAPDASVSSPTRNSKHMDILGRAAMDRRSPDEADPKDWLGLVLKNEDVESFNVSLSGCGDSGDIDDYGFNLSRKPKVDAEAQQAVTSRLQDLGMPGRNGSFSEILDSVVTEDATAEGNWYDNDGGTVYSEYEIEGGRLVATLVDLQYNDPEPDEDEDEDMDVDDANFALFAGQGGV